jgi:hypothetical protein
MGDKLTILEIVQVCLDIGTHIKRDLYLYVMPDYLGYDMILGLPWLERHDGQLEPKRGRLYLHITGTRLRSQRVHKLKTINMTQVSAAVMGAYLQRGRRTKNGVEVFAASLSDI